MTYTPRIENSERGITLNKQLAWTIGVALVVGGLWVGSTVAGLVAATDRLSQSLNSDRIAAQQIEIRVRTLENNASRQDARFEGMIGALEELKQGQRETNEMLKRIQVVR